MSTTLLLVLIFVFILAIALRGSDTEPREVVVVMPPRRRYGPGCGTWLIVLMLTVILLSLIA